MGAHGTYPKNNGAFEEFLWENSCQRERGSFNLIQSKNYLYGFFFLSLKGNGGNKKQPGKKVLGVRGI